jgi:pyrroline-5-carboxylate reductase
LTPIFPDDAAARQLFGELGGVIAVDDQNAFDALCSASASIASHLEYLAAVVDWLEGQGTRRTESRHYIGHIYSALAAAIASDEADFSELANEYSTPGGLNELMRNHLARHGVFTEVGLGLDAVHRRVAMKSF